MQLTGVEGDHLYSGPPYKIVEILECTVVPITRDHESRLKKVRRGHQSRAIAVQGLNETRALRFVSKNGHHR
jgi:hypothetical protein